MANRLAEAVSPYLRSHSSNPVDWFPWSEEAFAEAARRGVPVMISIGYSTCHWCHVMARETFSDPVAAANLNERFVAIKVDREEHPDVDSTYLAAAGAFTEQLGWPLTVFATPTGRAFYAGTYFPPEPIGDRPSFTQVIDAVTEAWTDRHDEVEATAERLAIALAASTATLLAEGGGSRGGSAQTRSAGTSTAGTSSAGTSTAEEGNAVLPSDSDFARAVAGLAAYEDEQYGGFGGAPKFPVATTILFLLDRADRGDETARGLATRTLDAMAASELRDPIEGGFFRYATRRDWSEPHYERMLYDNALLLDAYARAGRAEIAAGIAEFLLSVLRAGSGFASAQDSESTVDGRRVEGEYYRLDAESRARQAAPALDEKVLTGWNGLAIGALASAGFRLDRPDWIAAATRVADAISGEPIVRARLGDQVSGAKPTLEDFGMLAAGLVDLALATGEARFAVRARELVEQSLAAATDGASTRVTDAPHPTGMPFAVPGGADPVLEAHGLVLAVDPSEGAYPSGVSAMAGAAARLALLTGDDRLRAAAIAAMRTVADLAIDRPISFGASLGVLSLLSAPPRQLVVVAVEPGSPLLAAVRDWSRATGVAAGVTSAQAAAFATAGFELFEGRVARHGSATAYLCENFVCALPVTQPHELAALL